MAIVSRHAVEHLRGIVPLMRFVYAAEACRGAGELDDLVGRGEVARNVEETGAQPEGAVLHALFDQAGHLLDLRRRCRAIGAADDDLPNRALPDERADVQ